MSAVTRLHLLSQSMLNVSCQKQKHCSSLPAGSPTEHLMEFVGEQGPSGPCSLLGVPGFSSLDMDDDECEVVIGIRPKSSPLPRRRSSESDMDSWSGPPLSGSRRVSFADAKGLRLVQVKEFDTWDIPKLPKCDSSECDGKVAEEYFLTPLTFSLPLSTEELLVKVREQKVELETIKLLPGTTILKGVIRVLNVSFSKVVYVRTTLDTWSSHYDLLAEYMPDCSDSLTDCFSFKLTLVPPFGEQGARVDFCLRYETPVGTFWANNNNRNYVLFCHQREKEKFNKKSCLKTVSQNFSAVENISASEASSQDNISADGPEHGVEADCMKAKQICDEQSGTSEADRHTSLTESRQNCSRRSHRKTARMARVKDYFSQRKGGDDDTVRDESSPEAKQTTEEAAHSRVRSFPEGSSKSEGSSHFVSKSLETCSELLLDVPHDTSPAHDHACNGETWKSKSISVADSGGERSTDIPDNPSNDEPAPAGCHDINTSVSEVEESSQKQSKSHESISNIAAEQADSGVSAVTNSFTFGTVVAPLYHQVFGRMRSENPVRASLHVGSVSPNNPHTQCRQNSCIDPTDASGNDGEVQGNYLIATQESNQDMNEEEGTSLSMTANNVPDHAVTLQDPDDIIHSEQTRTNTSEGPEIISGDTVLQPHAVNVLSADVFNLTIPTESLNLREDNLTYDLQVPERTCRQTTTNRDETVAQSKTQDVMTSLESSSMSPPPSQSASECVSDETDQQTSSSRQNDCRRVSESNKDDDVSKTATISTTNTVSEKDQTFDALLVLDPKHVNNPATKDTENNHACCFDIEEEQDVTTPQILSVDMNNVEEVNTKNDQKKDRVRGDVSVEHKDEDARKVVHSEVEAAVAKQEDFCFDTSEVNWEMMVEEEEKIILTDEEECEAVGLKVVGKDQGQLEGEGRETPSENSDVTALEKEDEDVLESKESIEEEEIGAIVVGKDREGVEKELQYVQAPNTAVEEELADELEVEETEEQGETQLEKEKLFEKRSILEKTNVQDEEEKEEEEEMVIDLNIDNEAGVEERCKSREVNVEEENPDYKEGIPVDETGESEIVDAESVEDGGSCFEGTVDITQNKVEDGLSAPVNNVQDKSVTDKENGHIPAEMRLYREEDFQSNENVTCGLSKAASDENKPTAEGGWCIFTDEPESNQTGHDSASAESDSDDEMELYMHCLRAVHSGSQAQKDRGKDAGFGVGKLKHSSSRSKLLSTPMPSISESLDEEQHLSRLSVSHVDTETAGQPAAAALLASSGPASPSTNVSRWTDTFSCSNISKTLLNATLLVVFLVVAYHYDFLACFGLYMISVVWLYCQQERQPGKPKNKR